MFQPDRDSIERPYEIWVEQPFKGSIYGVHLGDTHDKVITILEGIRSRKIEKLYQSGNYYSVGVGYHWDFAWTEDESHRVKSMGLSNSDYIELNEE